MWALRWIFTVVVILLILGFALQNTTQEVAVVFLKGKIETGPLPIWLIVYASFGLGMIFWLFFSIFQVLALKNEMRKMRASNTQLRKELDNLRNLSIEADAEALPAEPPAALPAQTEEAEGEKQ